MRPLRGRLAAAMLVTGLWAAPAGAQNGTSVGPASGAGVAPEKAVADSLPDDSEVPEVAPETDRLLWCASAFYWLAGSAEDSGETEEAELYDGWSAELVAFAGRGLTALGYPPESIEALIAHYDAVALDELGSAEARYDIIACASLASG